MLSTFYMSVITVPTCPHYFLTILRPWQLHLYSYFQSELFPITLSFIISEWPVPPLCSIIGNKRLCLLQWFRLGISPKYKSCLNWVIQKYSESSTRWLDTQDHGSNQNSWNYLLLSIEYRPEQLSRYFCKAKFQFLCLKAPVSWERRKYNFAIQKNRL